DAPAARVLHPRRPRYRQVLGGAPGAPGRVDVGSPARRRPGRAGLHHEFPDDRVGHRVGGPRDRPAQLATSSTNQRAGVSIGRAGRGGGSTHGPPPATARAVTPERRRPFSVMTPARARRDSGTRSTSGRPLPARTGRRSGVEDPDAYPRRQRWSGIACWRSAFGAPRVRRALDASPGQVLVVDGEGTA